MEAGWPPAYLVRSGEAAMSSMSTGPGDQINVDRNYERERGSAWNWVLPLIALVVVAALLWALFGTRSTTSPSTSGASGTAVSTPASGTGAGVTANGGT